MPGETHKDVALEFLQAMKVAQLKEFTTLGVPSVVLRRLLDTGLVENPARGVYVLPGTTDDPGADYAIEAVSAPRCAMICLLTAAHLHGLIARDPRELWIAIPSGSWPPRSTGRLPVQCVQWSDLDIDGLLPATIGGPSPQDDLDLAGRRFQVTSPARTVIDLFAHRGPPASIGAETAVEALGGALERGVTIAELEHFAEERGILSRIHTYLAGAGASLNRRY